MEMNENRLEALDLNQQAAILIKAANFVKAKELIEKAIAIEPMVMDSYKNLGDIYMAAHSYEDAKNMYKKALLVEKQGYLYFLYGNACFMNNEVHEGLENYNLALTNGYDNEEMLFFVGMAYEHLNDDQMALRYFKKACMKNPSKPDYQVKMISVMLRIGLIEEAEKTTDKLLKNAPELFDGYHIKTKILLHKNEIEEAIEFSKAATEKFPEDVDILFDYIKCITYTDDLDKAEALVAVAKKMKYFEDAKARFLLLEAQIASEKGDIERAISICQECIGLEEEEQYFGDVRFMLLNLYLVNQNFENAYKEADDIVKKGRKDLFYHASLYYRPFALKQMGKEAEAQKLYKEVNAIYRLYTLNNPEALDVYLYRVMCLKDMEKYDKALDVLEFIEGISSEIAETYLLRGEIYHLLGKEQQAEEEKEKAYKLKPQLRQ